MEVRNQLFCLVSSVNFEKIARPRRMGVQSIWGNQQYNQELKQNKSNIIRLISYSLLE